MSPNCSVKTNASKMLEDFDLNRVRHIYFSNVSLPIASVGLLLVGLYIASIVRAMFYRRISKKCYVLLMDRAFGDVLACCVAIGIGAYVASVDIVNNAAIRIPEQLLFGTFWSSMVSYILLSLVKLYAVARPLTFRHIFTTRRCIYLIVISWSLYFCMVIPMLVMQVLVNVPSLSKWSGCKRETCTRITNHFRHGLILSCYPLTIAIFVGTVIYLRRAQRRANAGGRILPAQSANMLRFSIWKLGANVATFALFYSFQILYSIYVLIINPGECSFVTDRVLVVIVYGWQRNIMLMRIVVDPVVTFFVDKELRQSFLRLTGIVCDKKLPGRSKTYNLTDNSLNTSSTIAEASVTQRPCGIGTFD